MLMWAGSARHGRSSNGCARSRLPSWNPERGTATLNSASCSYRAFASRPASLGDCKSVLQQLCEAADVKTADRFQPWRQNLADGEAKKRIRAGGNYPTDGNIHPLQLCKEIKNFVQREAILSIVPDRRRRGGDARPAEGALPPRVRRS